MKTNLLFITAALLLAFSACNKVTESIQRDIITKTDSIPFELAISPNTSTPNNSIKDLPGLLNLTEEIKKAGGFELKDIVSIKLSSFIIALDSVKGKGSDGKKDTIYVDTLNNIRNFSSIKVLIKSGSKTDSLAKAINISPDARAAKATLSPLIVSDSLKFFVNAGNIKYDLSIQQRLPTTKIVKGKVLTNYTLTLRK